MTRYIEGGRERKGTYLYSFSERGGVDTLTLALGSRAAFTLVRQHQRRYLQVGLKDGKVTLTSSTVRGTGVSCLQEGSWGFACSTDEKDLPLLAEKALNAAERSSAKKQQHCALQSVPVTKGVWRSPVKEPVADGHVDEIVAFLRGAGAIVKEYPEVISSQIALLSTCDEKEIATSEGTRVTQEEYRLFCTAALTAKASGRRCTTNNAVGGQFGREMFSTETLKTMVREECKRAVRLLSAKMPPAGRSAVVLMPEVAAVLVHEAVGHTAEADVVAGGSYLSGKLGEQVGAHSVTLVDDGTYPQGFGTYGVDDEGVLSEKTYLIEKGYLKTYLHSRETAYKSGAPTGNARAWLYSGEPLIRMTNTYLEPHDHTLDELIETVKTGYLLQGVTSGLADHFGNFTLHVSEAQKIQHSALSPVVYAGVTVSANAFDLLSATIVGDSSTFVLIPGVCGKSETAFVGMGAPALATSMVLGGRV